MIVISLLGNPGKKYRRNRHNIGFIIASHLSGAWDIPMTKSVFSSHCGTGRLGTADVLLMMPQTYMNNSGTAVQQALSYHRVGPESLIVVHDEIELPFGVIRHKTGGGHKGHNGLRSIMEQLGTPDFRRVRVGVGRPENPDQCVADYVLSDFSADEMAGIDTLLPDIENLLKDMVGA